MKPRKNQKLLILRITSFCLFFLANSSIAQADAVLLIEEPINFLGHLTSTGHSAIVLDRLCSDNRITMRLCRIDEQGSVVSRYDGVDHYDWLAMDPIPYLFAVETADQIPVLVNRQDVEFLRTKYRTKHAHMFAADPGDKAWLQLIGAAYRRRIICIRIHTTDEQDRRLMAWLNASHNRSHFNFFVSNCSDFMRRVLDVLFPGSVHRNLLFDAGMTTPKQLAFALHRYARHHPELEFEVDVIPQVPSDISRSGSVHGVTESFVKTKPYLLPLGIIQPLGIGCVVAAALLDQRYNIQTAAQTAPLLIFGNQTIPQGPVLQCSREVAAALANPESTECPKGLLFAH